MHTIRLRHPWNCEQRDGQTCWSRTFNWPEGTAAGETVCLVIEPYPTEAEILLNARPLGVENSPFRFTVTDLLAEFNRLEITLPGEISADNQFPLEVGLEIQDSL